MYEIEKGLKKINDTLGHSEGDEAIQKMHARSQGEYSLRTGNKSRMHDTRSVRSSRNVVSDIR